MSHLKELGHRVHLVHYGHVKALPEDYVLMAKAWDSVTFIEKTLDYQKTGTGYYRADDWYQSGSGEVVANLCNLLNIDMVITNYIFFSKILDYIPNGVVKVLDTIDKLSERNQMFLEQDTSPDHFWTTAEEEKIALDRADVVLAIQDKERAYFETVTKKPVITLGHYEPDNLITRTCKYSLKKIGFLGGPNPVNITSLKEFITKFSQAVKDHQLDLELHIFGGICDHLDNNESKSVLLRGFAEDLKDVYEECDLIVNPLTFGTGLKIKTVEALSYGVPIISTAIGFEGITTDEPYFLLNNLDEMVDAIIFCYRNSGKLKKIQQSSIKTFARYGAEVEKSFNTLLSKVSSPLNKSNQLCLLHYDPLGRLANLGFNDSYINEVQKTINTALGDLARISFYKSPLKKFNAYKKLLRIFEKAGY
jgi:glycosyltransferase involved in cell wall biosynthesis